LLGITKLGRKPKDAFIMLMLTAFVAGMFLDIIIFDVYSVHYTEFMQRVLSYTSIIAVILAVLKNVYAPSKNSRMLLYISGFICFAFGGMFGIAELICFFATGQEFSGDVVKNIAFVLMGIYALDNALSVLPKSRDKAEKDTATEECVTETKEKSEDVLQIKTDISAKETMPEKEKNKAELPHRETVQHTEEIRKMLYTAETEISEKQIKKSVFVKDKKVFKGEKTAASKTEKVVYKKPKN